MSHACVIVAPTIQRVKDLGIEQAITWELEPFDENEKACFADGTRWDWYVVGGRWDGMIPNGNIVQIKLLDIESVRHQREEWAREAYRNYTERQNPFSDVQAGETIEQYVQRRHPKNLNPLHAYAFLRERHWHEGERMGWWGGRAYTECEIADMRKARANPEAWFGKCLHRDEATGAQIVCWNEPPELWSEQYYKRFIAPLGPEDTIAIVDYHV